MVRLGWAVTTVGPVGRPGADYQQNKKANYLINVSPSKYCLPVIIDQSEEDQNNQEIAVDQYIGKYKYQEVTA